MRTETWDAFAISNTIGRSCKKNNSAEWEPKLLEGDLYQTSYTEDI